MQSVHSTAETEFGLTKGHGTTAEVSADSSWLMSSWPAGLKVGRTRKFAGSGHSGVTCTASVCDRTGRPPEASCCSVNSAFNPQCHGLLPPRRRCGGRPAVSSAAQDVLPRGRSLE